jgi:hypothetical protein
MDPVEGFLEVAALSYWEIARWAKRGEGIGARNVRIYRGVCIYRGGSTGA